MSQTHLNCRKLNSTGLQMPGNLLLAMVIAVSFATTQAAWAKDPLIRHFRAGVLLGANLNAEFSTDGTFTLSGSQPGDPTDPNVNHNYDDGYVRVDNTGNAGGLTSNWGYNSDSQYDASADTFTFHSSQSFTASNQSSQDADVQLGFDMAYGGTIKRIGRTWISWELGFSFLPVYITDDSPFGATFPRIAYTYNNSTGILPPLAPYEGDSSGEGSVLSASGTESSGTEVVSGTISDSRTLHANLYNLRLGPHFHWDLNRSWSVEAMGGFAMALVDGNYKYNEVYSLPDGGGGSNEGEIDNSEIVYGGYAGVLTQVHVEKNAYFYGSAQFMSLSDADFSSGGRQAQLNLGQGLYFSFGFTWLF